MQSQRPLHILILSDRDWTHPQGGGTGTNLFGQVSRWIAWGHRVSVIACSYPGAAPGRAARPAHAPPRRRSLDRLPAGDRAPVARARAGRRRGARGRERHHLPHPAVAAHAARHADPPHPPRPLRARDGPRRPRRGAASSRRCRCGSSTGARASSRSRTRRPRDIAAPRDRPRAHRGRLHRRRARRVRARSPRRAPPSRRSSTSAGSSATSGSSCCSTRSSARPRPCSTSPATATTGPRSRPRSTRRGLSDRVRMHGHVTEDHKRELYQQAWVNVDGVVGRGLGAVGDGGRRVRDADRGARGGRRAGVGRGWPHGPAGARPRRPRRPDPADPARPRAARLARRGRARARPRVHLGRHARVARSRRSTRR